MAEFTATHVANPVEVSAQAITEIGRRTMLGNLPVTLANGETANLTPQMLARIGVQVGDYLIVQRDGYVYVNPKHVFEHKYRSVNATVKLDRAKLGKLEAYTAPVREKMDDIAGAHPVITGPVKQ